MGLSVGILGLPNVGKSTIFNALTAAGIAAENYPFCTIEPNSGIVPVPDERLAKLDAIVNSAQVLPATVEFTDIAGLVRGASQGEGLGNQFLGHVRETSALLHVIRCFDDDNVVHVDGVPDPVRDVETIEIELGLADIESLEKRVDRARKAAKSGDAEAKAQGAFFEGLCAHVGDGKPARTYPVPADMANEYRNCFLLTAKPILYIANVDEAGLAGGNPYCAALEARVAAEGGEVLRICGKVEAELSELEAEEKLEFLEDLGLTEPGLYRVIRSAYSLLQLISYFTAGPKEVRAWTVRQGTLAPAAAGEIHSDFERGFIRAEVIGYDDYIAAGGEVQARANGLMRVEGKEYVVQDGDVMHFRVGT
jgi:GTP-binding protein YchF